MSRSKGFGTLIKRGRYWQCKITVDGVNHYKATGTSSKVEAKKILEDFARPFQNKNEIERLAAVEAKIQTRESELSDSEGDYSNVPIGDILDVYYGMANAGSISEGTETNYRRILKKLTEFLGEPKLVRDVDKMTAERFLESVKPSVSAGYFNNMLALFRKIWKEFGRFSKHRCFRDNPWDGYRYKSADQSVRRSLTQAEIAKVFSVIVDADTRLLFKIGLYTGLRLGDCCKLKWSDVDMEHRFIRIVPQKTKRHNVSVVIPIHQALFEELETRSRALPEMPSDNPRGEYVSESLAWKYDHRNLGFIRQVFLDAGIETRSEGDGSRSVVSFHSLRHTFVSMSVSAGIPLDVVRQITGHGSLKMAEHYSHATAGALEQAVNAIPDIGTSGARKSFVEVDSEILKELNSMGLTVEDALKELIQAKANTITIRPSAA